MLGARVRGPGAGGRGEAGHETEHAETGDAEGGDAETGNAETGYKCIFPRGKNADFADPKSINLFLGVF